jgi:transposase
VSPTTVCKWRTRFLRDRLDGPFDEPRPGTPRQITDGQIEQVVIRTLETTPPGATHWSLRGMASANGLSHTTVSRIWHAFGLQPHRSETFKLSM